MCDRRDAQGSQASERHTVIADNRDIGGHVKPPIGDRGKGTNGGDVIREMIGAFPSLVLAEGEYVAIARRDGRTHQGTFTVRSGRDQDVEILTRERPRPEPPRQ